MKKYVFGILIAVVFVFAIGSIKCRDVLISITNMNVSEVQVNDTAKAFNSEKDIEGDEEKQRKVRIVLMDSDYSSIYHSNVVIGKGKNIVLKYGKKQSKAKKIEKEIKIKKDSSYFKETKKLIIENKDDNTKLKNLKRNNKINPYKGKMYLYKTKKGIIVVNEIDLEEYVAAVVSSEVSEKYPEEALKTQAVCARTYILNKIENDKNRKYDKFDADADDSTAFQVYNVNVPGKKSVNAAKDTNGKVIRYNKKLINAYYFSTSCGYTTDYEIWGKKMPYLKSRHVTKECKKDKAEVKDFDKFIRSQNCTSEIEKNDSFFRWNVKMTLEHIRNSVNNYVGYDIGSIEKIEINSRGGGGIVSNMTIYGTNSQINVSNQNEVRKILNPYGTEIKLSDGNTRKAMSMLPSAFISMEPIVKDGRLWGYKIYGGGFGHGSGMSQNAARKLAESGMDYTQIISFFYDGTEITK